MTSKVAMAQAGYWQFSFRQIEIASILNMKKQAVERAVRTKKFQYIPWACRSLEEQEAVAERFAEKYLAYAASRVADRKSRIR